MLQQHLLWVRRRLKKNPESKVTAHIATLTQRLCKNKGLNLTEYATIQKMLLTYAQGDWVTLAASLKLLNFLTSVCLNSHHSAASTFVSATDDTMHLLSFDIISTLKCLFLNSLRFRGHSKKCETIKTVNDYRQRRNRQAAFDAVFMSRTTFPLLLPRGSSELQLFLLSELTLIHFPVIL